jgi:hypothetical protein
MAYGSQLSATTQVKVGLGKLIGLVFSSTSSGTLVVYDTPDGDTNDTKIINTLTPAAGSTYYFGPNGIQFNKGLYLVVANTLQFTVIYE